MYVQYVLKLVSYSNFVVNELTSSRTQC